MLISATCYTRRPRWRRCAGPRPVRTARTGPGWRRCSRSLSPGSGQAYAGRRRIAGHPRGPILPSSLVVAGTFTGVRRRSAKASSPASFLSAVLVGNGVVLSGARSPSRTPGCTPGHEPRDGRDARLTTVPLLLVLTVAMHAWVGVVVTQLDATLRQVFGRPDDEGGAAGQPADAGAPAEEEPDEPAATDGTARSASTSSCSAPMPPGRGAALTDVVLVVSIDPVARDRGDDLRAARHRASCPFPTQSLYPGGVYPDKVNALMARAAGPGRPGARTLVADDPGSACGLEHDRARRSGCTWASRSITTRWSTWPASPS